MLSFFNIQCEEGANGGIHSGRGFRGCTNTLCSNKKKQKFRNMIKNGLFFKKKLVKTAKALGALPPNFRWPPAAGAPPQTPSYCSHILLHFEILRLLLVGHKNILLPGAGVP